ncbi:hypothetical protein [Halorussus litoreus]|uniref:hypothetical protein n=1 Tax=Halorussus litoreus TaxID=1710536 RepID=UPI001300AD8A|nr:hypothetical protein [Halorussus litoreus]
MSVFSRSVVAGPSLVVFAAVVFADVVVVEDGVLVVDGTVFVGVTSDSSPVVQPARLPTPTRPSFRT